jgi:photosystem II stability/assembly factor-like uncharacterized protein
MKKLYWLVFIFFLAEEIFPQNSNNLMDVCFTDTNNGTVVGDYDGLGVILRTTDGGTNWVTKYTGESCRAVSFTDANIGTAVGYDGIILKTKDGGNTWNNQVSGTTNSLNSVSFCDVNNGITVGDKHILMTTDSGNNWVIKYSGIENEFFCAGTYVDINTAIVVGVNWEDSTIGGVIHRTTEGVILRTTDRGQSWIHQNSGITNFLYDVCFTDANNGTVVGEAGIIFRTTNGGETWFQQSSGTTYSLNGVSFTDANNGTVVGHNWYLGIILKTTDGGNQWVSTSIGITQLYDVCFTDVNTGTIVGKDPNTQRNAILRTTDGGLKWVDQLAVHADTGSVTISGHVKYDNNEFAQFIYIRLYGVNSANTYSTYTDANGNYSVQVRKDSYYIYAKVPYNAGYVLTYRLKYYDNKSSLSEADLIEVNNDISNIDFTFPLLSQGTISGTVKDAITQQPLSNTVIEFYTAEILSDSNVVYTDQNGNYTIQVFEGNYILNAFRFTGYYRQYYKEAYSPFDATPITVSQDSLNVTGIDFYLTSPEPGSNIIRGYVRDKAFYSLSNVEVYAIPLIGGNWIAAKTNFFGEYILKDIKNGEYILLFYKEGFISEFYNDAYEWEDAFIFNLTGNQNITLSDVHLDSLNSFGGESSGNVSTNSGFSLSGTLLSAVNANGKIVSSTLSGYNGNYLIPYLENGNYKIKASKIGYSTCEYSGEVQIDLTNNPVAQGINILIDITGTEADRKKVPEIFELFQNYPNPFNPSTTIKYSIPELSFVTIKIYDVLGSEVAVLVNEEKSEGSYELNWNASNISSGVYFYQLKAGEFLQTKKMILLR